MAESADSAGKYDEDTAEAPQGENIRAIGVSNFSLKELISAMRFAQANGIASVRVKYNMFTRGRRKA